MLTEFLKSLSALTEKMNSRGGRPAIQAHFPLIPLLLSIDIINYG